MSDAGAAELLARKKRKIIIIDIVMKLLLISLLALLGAMIYFYDIRSMLAAGGVIDITPFMYRFMFLYLPLVFASGVILGFIHKRIEQQILYGRVVKEDFTRRLELRERRLVPLRYRVLRLLEMLKPRGLEDKILVLGLTADAAFDYHKTIAYNMVLIYGGIGFAVAFIIMLFFTFLQGGFAILSTLMFTAIPALMIFSIVMLIALLRGPPVLPEGVAPIPLLYMLRGKRARECERELPFIVTYLTLMASLGLSLSTMIEQSRSMEVLSRFKREMGFIKKIVYFAKKSLFDAFIVAADIHPSRRIAALYRSIASIERSGGDRFRMYYEIMEMQFRLLEDKISRLIEKFDMMTNMMVIAYVILPLSLLIVSMLFAGNYGVGMLMTSGFTLPVVFLVLFNIFVSATYPSEIMETPRILTSVYLVFAWVPALLLLFVVGLFDTINYYLYYGYGVKLDMTTVIGLLLILMFLHPAIDYYRYYRRIDSLNTMVYHLSRYVADEVKKGRTPRQAVVSYENQVKHSFVEGFVKRVKFRLKLGNTIRNATYMPDMPWVIKAYFEMLDIAEQFGSEYKAMDVLSGFMSRIYTIRAILADRAKGFFGVSVMLTIMLVLGLVIVEVSILPFMDQMVRINRMIRGVAGGFALPLNPLTGELRETVLTITHISVYLNVIMIALLTGKVTRGSMLAGLMYVPLFIAIVMISYLTLPSLVSQLGFTGISLNIGG